MNKKSLIGISLLLLSLVIAVLLTLFSGPKIISPDLSQEDAINTVIAAYPELAAYKTASLPPSSIEVRQAGDGWYVGFIQSGSGLPGILTAKCYRVSNAKSIESVGAYERQGDATVESIQLETCMPTFAAEPAPTSSVPASVTPPAPGDVLAYGDVTLNLNQRAAFKDLSIRPVAVVEDSRCPRDVQCIWAGTVRVKVEVISAMGKSEGVLTLGQPFTTEVESITLTGVSPAEKHSETQIAEKDYRLTFTVVPR